MLIFASIHLNFGTPSGTESFNVVNITDKSVVSEENQIPVLEDKLTSIGGLESILFLTAHGKQFLNFPIFWLSVLIDIKGQKVLGNRLEQ